MCLCLTTCDGAHPILQILCFKNLMKRNREKLASSGAPPQNSAISLPFIVVNTSKKTTIDCSISSDKCVEGHKGRGLRVCLPLCRRWELCCPPLLCA